MSRQKWNDIFRLLGVVPPDQIDPLEGINIQEEFNLIAVKKSNLSARMRGLVVARMNQATLGIRKLAKAQKILEADLEDFIAENMKISIDEQGGTKRIQESTQN